MRGEIIKTTQVVEELCFSATTQQEAFESKPIANPSDYTPGDWVDAYRFVTRVVREGNHGEELPATTSNHSPCTYIGEELDYERIKAVSKLFPSLEEGDRVAIIANNYPIKLEKGDRVIKPPVTK